MITQWLRSKLKTVFWACGFDIRRIGQSGRSGSECRSLREALSQIRRMEVCPQTVIDVGAAYGSFSRECADVFPDARYFLVEPLLEYEASLRNLMRRLPSAHYVGTAVSSQSGQVSINVHPDLVGSSLLREVELGTDVNGVPRAVHAVTIDDLVEEYKATGPLLLKVDVQGAELNVLRGARTTLRDTEYVLLEVSLFRFFEDGPDFFDVFAFMKGLGFVAYDIIAPQYRPLDEALSQVDVAFVKENGPLRELQYYATPFQRAEQTQQIRLHLKEVLGADRHQTARLRGA